jgi:hypothetical protein
VTRMTTLGWFWVLAGLALWGASCSRNQGPDPASANMAPTEPADQSGQLAQNEAPVQSANYDQQLSQAPAPPPPLPDYSQPECPGDNYLWTPGYWAYSSDGYYWVPGVWVEAPFVGALWTPPWWGYSNGRYLWNAGYWGPYVGFYGGINYGFGYTGRGYFGGYWQSGSFNYNSAVENVNVRVVRNVYRRSVTNYTPANRIAYNGGQGGLSVRPTASEQVAQRQRRMSAAPAQIRQERAASANRAQFALVNGGRPAVAAERPQPAANERPAREAPPVNARPEERAPMQTNNARPETGPLNVRPAPVERPRPEQTPRPAAPAPEVRPNREAQREAQPAPQPRPMEARPAPEARPVRHPEPAARPPAPQPRPAPEPRTAPQHDDRTKHQQ